MATTITEDCIVCGACEDECPTGAIRLGNEIFVVDAALCTECLGHSGTRMCADVCPTDCCVLEESRPGNAAAAP